MDKILKVIKKLPRIGTVAYKNYSLSFIEINKFINFFLYCVGGVDYTAKVAHDALVDVANKNEKEKLLKDWSRRTPMVVHLKGFKRFFLETILVRVADNYTNYLCELVFEIFTKRPETLKSSYQVDLKTIVQHNSINSLLQTISKKKVNNLSYKSFSEIKEFFCDSFGINLDESYIKSILIVVELRNIIVHNRGIVDKLFIEKVGDFEELLNKPFDLHIDLLEQFQITLTNCVIDVDRDVRKSLKIRAHRYGKLF